MPRWIRPLLSCSIAGVAAAACWAPNAPLHAPAPDRYSAFGDTSRFGPVIVGVDSNARFVQLNLREASRVELFTVDRQYHIYPVVSCYAEAGVHTLKPANRGSYNIGRDALMVVVISEEPRYRANCDVPSTSNRSPMAVQPYPMTSGSVSAAGVMPPNEALQRLPLTLLRYPGSAWASYLVEP